MDIEQILESLRDYLHKGENKKTAHCDRIDALLGKLEEKRKKLAKRLEKETNPTKKKRINTDLKIVALQLKKARKRREELDAKCK